MIKRPNTNAQRLKRHKRVRGKISGTPEMPRLNVFRSEAHIYAQVIDDVNGVTWLPLPLWIRPSKVTAATSPLPLRWASWLPSAPRPRVLRPSCSTAVVICITAVCRPWLRAPVKAA